MVGKNVAITFLIFDLILKKMGYVCFKIELAKFQLSSTFLSQVIIENVFLRYRDFKLRDPFLAKIDPFLPNIFKNPKNIRYFGVWCDINHRDT